MAKAKPPILIIESNPPTLLLYRRELSRDFKVLVSSGISEALALIKENKLAAVVLEPEVSNGQGWTLLPELKRLFFGKALPIILCSTLDDRKRGLEAGAVDFLVKPVLPSVLIETIHRAIHLSS